MSPWPSSCSAPGSPRMVRLSILELTRKLMRDGRLALITPVSTSTEGRWVATIRWMPAARAFCDRRWIAFSISLPAVSIRSATSSTMTTISGSGVISIGCSSKIGTPVPGSKPVRTRRFSSSPLAPGLHRSAC